MQDIGDRDIDGDLFLVARVYKIGKISIEILVLYRATVSVIEMASSS